MHHTRLGSSLQIQPLSDPSKILSLGVMVCIQLFYFNKKYRIKRRANFEFSTSSGWLAVEIRYLEHRLCCPCAVLTLSSHGRTSIPLPHGTLHDKGDASRSCLPFPGTKKNDRLQYANVCKSQTVIAKKTMAMVTVALLL